MVIVQMIHQQFQMMEEGNGLMVQVEQVLIQYQVVQFQITINQYLVYDVNVNVNEGEDAIFTISLSNKSTQDVVFDLSNTNGTATTTNDYTATYYVSIDSGIGVQVLLQVLL